ncbi:hypothetical protein PMAYCL1PPCAC_20753, partial [Pristionchus mayeri]
MYLFFGPEPKDLASVVLMPGHNEAVGRLLLMHMHNDENAEVLTLEMNKFGTYSFTKDAFKPPTTLKIVLRWWKSDLKEVESMRTKRAEFDEKYREQM